MNGKQAIKFLTGQGIGGAISGRLLEIASQHGYTAHPVDDGILDIRYSNHDYQISFPAGSVATGSRHPVELKPTANRTDANGRRSKMAPRKAQVAEPEPEASEEPDYTKYANKEPTPTMADFAEWLLDEVFGGEFPGTAKEQAAFETGVRLGGSLRMEFQKSEFNISRREARKAERAAGNGSAEEEAEATEPAKPARARGKAPAKPASQGAAKPATRRGRGRGTGEAPF